MFIDTEVTWDDSSIGRTFTDPAAFGNFIEALTRTALTLKTLVTIQLRIENSAPIEINISGDLL